MVGTLQGVTHPLGQFACRQHPVGFHHLALGGTHLGSIGLSQGLLIVSGLTARRTPCPVALTRRLWACSQVRTAWLLCQAALSQTSRARLSRAAAS
jgi:hypothetical protein